MTTSGPTVLRRSAAVQPHIWYDANMTIIVTEPADDADAPKLVSDADLTLGVSIGEMRAHISNLISRVDSLESHVEITEGQIAATQTLALSAAEEAIDASDTVDAVAESVDEVIDALENEPEPEPEPVIIEVPEEDTPPGKTHWLQRPAREWFGRND